MVFEICQYVGTPYPNWETISNFLSFVDIEKSQTWPAVRISPALRAEHVFVLCCIKVTIYKQRKFQTCLKSVFH